MASIPFFRVTKQTSAWPFSVVGPADDSGLGHEGVRDDGALDLGRADPVPRDVQHVVNSADDPEIAVLVEARAVTREIVSRQLAPVLALDSGRRRPRAS